MEAKQHSPRHISIEIEPTNFCNTECLHCPHGTISRPYGKMDWETYQTIMDKIMAYTPSFNVGYAGMGEPLLNPLIYDFIEYVSSKGTTYLTTNASALTPKNAERLVRAGLDSLCISFNGEDRAVYELMMGGLDFERAQKNLRNAVGLARGTRTHILANVSVTRQTQGRLPDIRHFLEEAGVKSFFFSKCHNRGGFLKGDLVCNTPPPPVEDGRCDIFTGALFAAWTGEVLSCCHDLAGTNVVGDFRTETLAQILDRKEKLAEGGVRFEICKGCNDLYRFNQDQEKDVRSASQWVYDLYSPDAYIPPESIPVQPQPPSSLAQWMVKIYDQEGQLEKLALRQAAELSARDRLIRDMQTQVNQERQKRREAEAQRAELKAEAERLDFQLQDILHNRLWRVLKGIQGVRLALIPLGSRRERLFHRLLG